MNQTKRRKTKAQLEDRIYYLYQRLGWQDKTSKKLYHGLLNMMDLVYSCPQKDTCNFMRKYYETILSGYELKQGHQFNDSAFDCYIQDRQNPVYVKDKKFFVEKIEGRY